MKNAFLPIYAWIFLFFFVLSSCSNREERRILIVHSYEESYVGKIINDYDGKQMLVAAIGAYHKGLLGNVLDKSYDNVVAIDIDAQRTYLESRGMDTSEMDDIAVAKANTGTKVFIASNVKFVNAMEDLKMNVNM